MFDEVVNRRNTNSLKHDAIKAKFKRDDVLPLWVADMDFSLASPIYEVIQDRIKHNVFGYPVLDNDFFTSISHWYKKKDIDISTQDIIYSNSVVSSLIACVLSFCDKGDRIVIQPPIYPPFFDLIKHHDMQVIENNLLLQNGRYEIDFEDLDNKLKNSKMFLLCNPQNPTGRSFSKEELLKIIKLCIKHDTLLISDEIHSDIIFDNKVFNSILSFDEAKDISVVLNSSTKGFNLAGLPSSYAISRNQKLLKKIRITLKKHELSTPNTFGSIATVCAYTKCDDWLKNVVSYIQSNRDMSIEFIKKNIPLLKPIVSESTYLLWIDFSDVKQSHNQIEDRLLNSAKIGLNNGLTFGDVGNCFFRLNLGASKKTIEQGLKLLQKEFS